ncbi:hypothetical protein [Nannocystis pusilla]|uniref:Lipoprotein n=1 Tax=Nannocystis pusilla TaxID=889268 RepID=A0ABS7U169_9BACT|nr:hypothetical protein [Nannocystis pusilla]MBZ5714267.1 hypothetical protein [Nannocystis pusilla]
MLSHCPPRHARLALVAPLAVACTCGPEFGRHTRAVRELPYLTSVTFYESSGAVVPLKFDPFGPELNARLPDPLGPGNCDVAFEPIGEYYDFYYSDRAGNFDAGGSYITISAVYPVAAPERGGLNVAEVELRYLDLVYERADTLGSFAGLGDNFLLFSVDNAVDDDLATTTTMGNTTGDPGERLRITVGFESSLDAPM